MRVLNRDLPSPIRDIDLSTLLSPNYGGFLKGSLTFPFKLYAIVRELAGQMAEVSAVDLASALAEPAAQGPLHRAAGSSATSRRSSPTRTAATTSGCSSASSTSPPPTSTRPSA